MTMRITIKNEDQTRVGNIQHWENNALESCEPLLPGESKSIYLHSTKYVTIEECGQAKGRKNQDTVDGFLLRT
ncbi:MAG: hypothetical protein ACYDG4_13425 [Desulfuromonadaceae bacterium]